MIKVYSKPKCMQCDFTKKFLEEKGVSFEVYDVTENEEVLEEVRTLGFASLPVVVVEGQEPWSGFQPDRLETLVNK